MFTLARYGINLNVLQWVNGWPHTCTSVQGNLTCSAKEWPDAESPGWVWRARAQGQAKTIQDVTCIRCLRYQALEMERAAQRLPMGKGRRPRGPWVGEFKGWLGRIRDEGKLPGLILQLVAQTCICRIRWHTQTQALVKFFFFWKLNMVCSQVNWNASISKAWFGYSSAIMYDTWGSQGKPTPEPFH